VIAKRKGRVARQGLKEARSKHVSRWTRTGSEAGGVRTLIGAFLKVGVMEDGLVSPAEEGTPQGGPLSPLLSNVVLDELDRELERRKHHFVRYADDCNIYVRSERAGRRVMISVTRFLARRLKLKVNESKSAVARPDRRKFLGFSFAAIRSPNDGSRRRLCCAASRRSGN